MKRQSLWILAAVAGMVLSSGAAWAAPTPVPEPTSLSLFAAAIGVAAWAKFRRRK